MQSIAPELDAPRIHIGPPRAEYADRFVGIDGVMVTQPGLPTVGGAAGNTVVYAFRPTDEERQRIADGADIYVSLCTYGGPPQGIIVMAGKEEASAVFNVRALEAQPT